MNFITWRTMADIGFWSRLTKKKIQEYKLDSDPKPLFAKFRLTNKSQKISTLSINAYSFGDTVQQQKSGPVEYYIRGIFVNFNTVEQFNKLNFNQEEQKLLNAEWQKIKKFVNGQAVQFLTQIKMFIFGDFKKHLFKYVFLSSAIPVEDYKIIKSSPACSYFPQQDKQKSLQKLNQFVNHFCVKQKKPLPQVVILKNFQIVTMKQFLQNQQGDYIFSITDTSNYENHTGFQTSTVLSLFSYLREEGLIKPERLLSTKILLMKQFLVYGMQRKYQFKTSQIYQLDLSGIRRAGNEKKISTPQKVQQLDLKSFMDDKQLARQAVDLNIKLMKWRLLPTLNIEKIQSRKCLLFGAGTLGCQLARNLIGWGIKNITFIDYSNVSYSNPVRQTLYDFEDTIKGGKPKAQTAAQKLVKIYPFINAKGIKLSIPMPGHYVTKEEHIKQTFQNLETLEKLVEQHDVLFLLLDSRQARWLPTVLANKYDKACITVGLGFDSFVIVRHGVSPALFQQSKHKQRICCYFCNDIITPQNTMKDRTLDQQCTVTRPGLSFLASAYASQLYISLIHHPLQHKAPAHEDSNKLQQTDLGKLPHHIRGNMSDFQTHLFYGRAFDKCVACSQYILKQYSQNKQQFMLKVLNDPSFIHEVVHLKEQLEQFDKMQCNIIEIIDDDYEQELTPNTLNTNAEQPKETPKQTKEQVQSQQQTGVNQENNQVGSI